MGSLSYLEDYIKRFHCIDFSEFTRIYDKLYLDYEDLRNRIEFSLLINPQDEFDLRFGLFKLYNTKTIRSFLNESDYDISNLDETLNFAENFAPEMALGFDYNNKNSRLKIYLLRLPDNPAFNTKPIKSIEDFLKINGIKTVKIDEEELKNCYILGVDFYKTNHQCVKIYSREKDAEFLKTKKYLEDSDIHSRYFEQFLQLFSEEILKDTTISKKYSKEGFESLSIIFEVANYPNQNIEKMIEASIPNRVRDFKEIINLLEFDAPIKYSHIGLTFSEKSKKESLCIYYSPVFEVQK
jgi:hypothetical protein